MTLLSASEAAERLHSPDCDGYGYLHGISPRRVFENGGYMWIGECVCGYRTGYAGSPETVKYLGREHRGADVCTGQCMGEQAS